MRFWRNLKKVDTSDKVAISVDDLAELISSQLERNKHVWVTVSGNSMYPLFISGRDEVCLAKSKKYKRNDIVFYNNNGVWMLHRIIKIKGGVVACKGDNVNSLEPPIKPNDIVAKVIKFKRKNKVYSTKSFKYRAFVFMWFKMKFMRPFFLKVLSSKKVRRVN